MPARKTISEESLLVNFIIAVTKIPDKKQFKGEEGLFWIRVGGDEAAGHTVCRKEEREMGTGTQLAFSV